MSEKHESRKYKKFGNLKESKRPIILVKKDENKDNDQKQEKTSEGPNPPQKIILKLKEKDQPKEISIITNLATRESKEMPQSIQSPARKILQCKDLNAPVSNDPPPPILQMPLMTKPIDLITPNLILNTQAFEFINETNSLFHVIGVIGQRGVGKSTIMNCLTIFDYNENESFEKKIFVNNEGVFPINDYVSSSYVQDSIQMFITKDRKILLDCCPVLSNPAKKDCALSEIDDLKLIIFLLSVCHLLIVVQDDYFNLNLIRLIQNAEMMKPNFTKEDELEHLARLLFIKNKADRLDFALESKRIMIKLLKAHFRNSKLRIHLGNYSHHELKTELPVNMMTLSKIEFNQKLPYHGFPNPSFLINEIRQRVFMSPRNSMLNTTTPFTEKLWSQLVINVWESHKTNFFLRKFETLKEKPISYHGHGRDRENENCNSKDRNIYDYS